MRSEHGHVVGAGDAERCPSSLTPAAAYERLGLADLVQGEVAGRVVGISARARAGAVVLARVCEQVGDHKLVTPVAAGYLYHALLD